MDFGRWAGHTASHTRQAGRSIGIGKYGNYEIYNEYVN